MKTTRPAALESAGAGRRRWWPWAAAAGALALLAFVLVWFQPQKLLIDERVDEAVPTVAPVAVTTSLSTGAQPAPPSTSAQPAPPSTSASADPQPLDLAGGRFVSLDHGTSGSARVLQLDGARRVVRLEGLQTDNGPDLYLYLSANPPGGPEQAFDDDFVSLGRLKGNQGDQNYELPAGTDLARYHSVVIWCDRFNSAFGAAALAGP